MIIPITILSTFRNTFFIIVPVDPCVPDITELLLSPPSVKQIIDIVKPLSDVISQS